MINLTKERISQTGYLFFEMGRILIVDDEIDICLMLSQHLKALNFEADYVTTVKQAIQNIETYPYDLLFLDLNLLEGSGYDVMEYAKRMNLPSKIIVISAHDSEASKVIEKGADIFIAKPFTTRTIREALKTLHILPS